MIEAKRVIRYTFTCETCGYNGGSRARRTLAEADEQVHALTCGRHFEAHDSTGGYRGILGGYNRYCVCGAHYVTENIDEFKCPRKDKHAE